MNLLRQALRVAPSLLLAAAFPLASHAGDAGPDNHLPADYTGRPLGGTPQPIPGKIEAESYDVAAPGGSGGADGVAVHYPGSLRKTPFRPDADSAGLGRFGAGHVSIHGQAEAPEQVYAGWTDSGEWFAYTVRVAEAGTYRFGGKFASAGKKSVVSVTFSPSLTTGPVSIPTTAGYQPAVEVYHVWETLDNLKEITLPAGTYVMKVKLDVSDGLNVDYFTFTRKP